MASQRFSAIDWEQFTRLMIMETVAENFAGALVAKLRDHVDQIKSLPAFGDANILAEEDGRMVCFQVTFSSRARLLEYHQGREYRQLLQHINHLLIGDPVIKLFRRYEPK